jgi:hypothetical protein
MSPTHFAEGSILLCSQELHGCNFPTSYRPVSSVSTANCRSNVFVVSLGFLLPIVIEYYGSPERGILDDKFFRDERERMKKERPEDDIPWGCATVFTLDFFRTATPTTVTTKTVGPKLVARRYDVHRSAW